MKKMKFYYLLFSIISFIFISCDKENANDCIQTAGKTVQKEYFLNNFDEIIVNDKIELYVIDSDEQKIIVETGENFLNDIDLNVTSNILEIENFNSCLLFKDFGTTKVFVYASDIKKIRNASTLTVSSIGILNYPRLELISDDFLSDFLNSGDFNLEINSDFLSIIDNGYSKYSISGNCTSLNINFASNGPRFEGENLLVENAFIFNRSTNDILIQVTNEINGDLYSTGDVILLKEPLINNLKAHFTGSVITNY